ncbi:MAG: cobalt-precorrin-6A reductase [Methyloceanibacter sp.]
MTGSARMTRILILGGTSEARRLAEALGGRADIAVTVSLAGRTVSVPPLPVPVRIGGFGGADGLADYLRAERIDALIDATHPHAEAISANAAEAASATGVDLLALRRPAWTPQEGDRWVEVASIEEAVAALGHAPRRVFLALGRNTLQPFATAPQHIYLIRSVDPVDPPLAVPYATYITARGPFSETEDRALLTQHRIELVVAKNSGGEAARGKIDAARALGLRVIMLKRPALPEAASVETVEEVLAWLDHAGTFATARGV